MYDVALAPPAEVLLLVAVDTGLVPPPLGFSVSVIRKSQVGEGGKQ